MPIYQVDEGQVSLKPVRTTEDFAELMASAPMDLGELEQEMMTLEQQSVPVIHHFAPGIYIREMKAFQGNIILGHRHTVPHLNVVLSGSATMNTGRKVMAPMAFTGYPGRKCAVFHEDTAWLNVYATDEQDIGTLENMFMEKTAAALAQEYAAATEVTDAVLAAQADFALMLEELSITSELVSLLHTYQADWTKLPWGSYKFRSARSPIGGNGVFASAPIEAGEHIGPATVSDLRTVLAYGVNHSGDPNAKIVRTGYGMELVALRPIGGNRGGIFGEEITVNYRDSRKAVLCVE